ncbi:hypothetical protein [Plantactinospora sp. WMMB782]|uniref:hypothetical protein n=1 Tax=Plantactinospora sp. WMMB782 TaxID=3404121 RepID=UPI003B938DB5
MAALTATPTLADALRAADRNDLWQEDDQRTTHEYIQEVFGLSDPWQDVTEQADAAARDGLIRLHVSNLGARRWELTEAGAKVLADLDKE